MNVILLTVLALSGTGGEAQIAAADDVGIYADESVGASGHAHKLHHATLHGGCMGPMPQTCYEPPYGCYHGSRWNNRYPAFHGTYYRKAYNYRNYFDYPWHAEMHEPTSQWSFHVTGDTGAPAPLPAATPEAEKQVPPLPTPTPASLELPLVVDASTVGVKPKRTITPANSLRTLRR
jgi:hypothetical protein